MSLWRRNGDCEVRMVMPSGSGHTCHLFHPLKKCTFSTGWTSTVGLCFYENICRKIGFANIELRLGKKMAGILALIRDDCRTVA